MSAEMLAFAKFFVIMTHSAVHSARMCIFETVLCGDNEREEWLIWTLVTLKVNSVIKLTHHAMRKEIQKEKSCPMPVAC